MERVLVLANKYAGALSRLGQDSPLLRYAREAGLEPQIVHTRSASHLRRVLREQVLGKEHKVVVAGGDGTLHSAVQVLARTDVVLGILPQGTANNFATALRLPMDLPSAFRVIATGEERRVSLGDAEGEYFTEAAGVGLFAEALALSGSGGRTKHLGRVLSSTLRLWLTNQTHPIGLTLDGERTVEQATMVTVANSFRIGMGFPVAPSARLTDDLLDVIIFGALTRREMIPYLKAVRAQAHADLPKVQTLQAKTVHIRSTRPLRVHVDDRARRRTPITLTLVPDALGVMVDRL